MSEPYRPSNGSEGLMFQEQWCNRCRRDRAFRESSAGEDGCPILADTMFYMVDDPNYPKEWVWNPEELKRTGVLTFGSDDGPRCTAFEEDGA